MLDRFTSMQVFVKVVQLGSFSAAARALALSPTMVTKHVTTLEDRLGVTLFRRSTRHLSLTEAGRLFLEGSQRILADMEDMELTVSEQRHEARGHLRLNAPVSFAIRYVAPYLPEFNRLHPHVSVELGLNDRTVDLIDEGWDLTLRIRKMPSSTLRSRRLATIRMVVCAAPAYLERAGTPTRVEELSQHQCLGYTLSGTNSASRWSFGEKGEKTVPVSGPLSANNGDVLREAALAGEGIVYQPVFVVSEELRTGRLRALTLDLPPVPGPDLHAVYAPGISVSLKIRAMIDYLSQCYTPTPPWEQALAHTP
ncbi:LysR family transcriptional regulator [Acetobacter fabarum]|jgi:DNA-binding transcriptional LysR family regulator|uniref:LysR family transcriptional regulator n=1 Tax=Acetobacter fabarum TaxID=483199 RepID=A0A269XYM4_9PROT|nr:MULTISPECIES: substrate binding domain-containing protein [Acetobacter]MDN6713924.1 LysR substrate-binding domain-containing protein [Acetobacter sp.]MCH4024986.1 LysR substrate-binding domain-containing protein [Acetobacter fabarum]MCH4128566.1 LysR substrate-binding domain-containing protein [Acetobacter fabarum]MCH4141777.1 LysR substrate-binding domain-containing protein [Acetobacter fabarum]MCI1243403.1 LysR substrate-binding domain-containing protein [Acetobacter fabarum]